MNRPERAARLLADLDLMLDQSAQLAARGRQDYCDDPALPLAFEALCNRVGELCKRLIATDQERFADPVWEQAARNRDFVVHHYDRVDRDILWQTITVSFPILRDAAARARLWPTT